jgi:hypothetical protein
MYSTPVDLSFFYLRSAVEASLDTKKVQMEPNTICSSYFVFRGIMFCRKFRTLVLSPPDILLVSRGLFSEWLLILYPMKLSNSF